jgi:3-oxoacyl-(acyl-carrier-protein) synthase
VFGEHAAELPVTSIKGHVGRTGPASGAMRLLAGLHGMQAGTLVQVAGTTDVEPEARFHVITRAPPRPTSTCCRSTGSASAGRRLLIVARA